MVFLQTYYFCQYLCSSHWNMCCMNSVPCCNLWDTLWPLFVLCAPPPQANACTTVLIYTICSWVISTILMVTFWKFFLSFPIASQAALDSPIPSKPFSLTSYLHSSSTLAGWAADMERKVLILSFWLNSLRLGNIAILTWHSLGQKAALFFIDYIICSQ